MATPIGFEPTISTVTGWRARPLHHGAAELNLCSCIAAGQRLRFRPPALRARLATMPASPRRDPAPRRRLPPRPTFASDAQSASIAATEEARFRRDTERALAAADRESRFLVTELKRVAGVTATCVTMLVVLAVLQRLQA